MYSIQRNPNLTVLTVALGTFMTCFDINAVNVALPSIQNTFQTGISVVEWVVVAYLLTLCATQLTFGRISDLYGLKKIYILGFIGFTLSSLFCGFSPNITTLILFRVLEALCGSMMMATGSAIITNSVLPENRGKALSVTSIAVAVSTCPGPSLGGLLVFHFGWSSIFFINVPVGIIGTTLAIRNISSDTPKAGSKFDPMGSIFIMAALTLIFLPLSMIGKSTVNPVLFSTLLVLGTAFLVAFLVHEKNCPHPILNLALFKNRVFAASNFAATFFYISEFMMVFLSPYYLQQQHMLPISTSGLIMLPMSLMMMATAPVSGAISDKSDGRLISCIGLGILAAAILTFSAFRQNTPVPLLLLAFAITGLGAGLFHTPNNSIVMGSVPAQSRGVAGATLGTMRNIGMVLGEALSAALLSSKVSYATAVFSARGMKGIALQQSAFLYALRIICVVAACCALAALLLTLFRGKKEEASC